MAVYVVGLLRVRNWDWFAQYVETTERVVARHGGVYLGRGVQVETLEGDAEPPTALVMIEFPTDEAARAWHQDPDYIPMIELRKTGCDTELMLAQAVVR